MKKLDLREPKIELRDPIPDALERIKNLFPSAVTEDKIDFDVLKQLLGGTVDEREEKYGLNWHGKRQARQLALTPSTGTLRPRPDESVDWATTQNLMIEGDNLEVLKLLQKSYAGKVKMIYIDPPYNTGRDFVYSDSFADNIRNYLEQTGQIDNGNRISSNTETSGRFHSDWLSMMYPRLKLARGFLEECGTVFISVDEREFQNLRLICNDVFGEECFVGTLVILSNPKGRSQDKYFATNHEYVVVYSKTVLPKGFFAISKEDDQIEAEYPYEDDGGKYRTLELRNTHREFGRHNRRNLFYPLFVDADGNVSIDADDGLAKVLPLWSDGYEGCWTWQSSTAAANLFLLTAREVDGTWKIYRKSYANGADRMLKTILNDSSYFTERGQKEFNSLFNTREKLFQSPKSPYLLAQLIQSCTGGTHIILDFFAWSGTTGQAVLMQNLADGSSRRYMLVQLPQLLDPEEPEQRLAAQFCESLGKPMRLSEITKERLRRAAKKIERENPEFDGDRGFRSFSLDSSNIHSWQPDTSDIEQLLIDSTDHLKPDRDEKDILYEILLKLGIDLSVDIEERHIAGKTVQAVSGGVLITCLAESVPLIDVERLGVGIADWHQTLAPPSETVFVFRDSAFENDVAKTNLTAILAQRDLTNVRSI